MVWKNCVFGLCGVREFHRRTFSVVVTAPNKSVRRGWLRPESSSAAAFRGQVGLELVATRSIARRGAQRRRAVITIPARAAAKREIVFDVAPCWRTNCLTRPGLRRLPLCVSHVADMLFPVGTNRSP